MQNIIGVGVILKSKEGDIILQERDNHTHKNPNQIAPFGGGIEKKESPLDCARREIEEELSIELNKLIELGSFESDNNLGSYIQMYLSDNIDPHTLQLQEGRSVVQLSLEEAVSHHKVTSFTKRVLSTL